MRNKFDHVEGKQFTINIKHFHKTTWFWTLISGSVALLLLLYRNRMNKQRRILLLETKAEALEKEKTLVQYEFKQQLNPTFYSTL